jgi:peptidase E
METKLILHGGFDPTGRQENDPFFKEMLRDAPNEAKVLLVYFAKEDDRVPKNREEDIEQFNKNREGKTLSFETATRDAFLEQVQQADVIYLHGGRTKKLLEGLKGFSNFGQLFHGKIVAGDSAGANVLATAFYSSTMGIGEGFGILPIKVICHYVEENKDKLAHIRPDLETLFLKSYQYKVFDI